MTDQPRILGSLRAADGTGVVRIEETYDTDAADLWSAVTDPERLARWYGRVTGDLRQGGEFTLRIEGPDIDAVGQVHECDPPRRLRVGTRETDESAARGDAPPYDATITVDLTTDGARTLLVAEVAGLPLDKLAAFGSGWQINAESLTAYLTGSGPVDAGARWAELLPVYDELLPGAGGGGARGLAQ